MLLVYNLSPFVLVKRDSYHDSRIFLLFCQEKLKETEEAYEAEKTQVSESHDQTLTDMSALHEQSIQVININKQ